MTIPKIIVDAWHRLEFRKDDVEPSGKVAAMQAKSESHCMGASLNADPGLGILPPNLRHKLVVVRRSQTIHNLLRREFRGRGHAERARYGSHHRTSDWRRNAVPNHSEAVPDRRMEAMSVREPLKSCRLSDGDNAGLIRMQRSDRLKRAFICASSSA